MLDKLSIIILALFFFLSFTQEACFKDVVRTYFFETQTVGFGRAFNESLISYGSASIECVEQKKIKTKLRNKYLIYIPDLRIEQKTQGFGKNAKPAIDSKILNVTKALGSFTTDEEGIIVHVFVQKKENSFVQGVLKTVISMFSSTRSIGIRPERVQQGLCNVLYRNISRNQVEKSYGYRSLLAPAIKGQRKRDVKFSYVNLVTYNDRGVITKVQSTEEARVGLTDEQRKEYAVERGHMYDKNGHAKTLDPKRAELVTESETASLLVLKDETVVLTKKSNGGARTLDLGFMRKTDLRVEKHQLDHSLDIYKEKFKSKFNFENALRIQRENPNKKTFTKLLHYCRLFPKEVISTLIHTYKHLDLEKPSEKRYAESILAMITVTQTKEGQKLLATAIAHPLTSHSAMLNTVHLEEPSMDVVDTLAEIYEKYKNHEEKTMNVLANNAYLLMAGTASKLKNEHAHTLVRAIAANLENSQDAHEWNLHLRALKNAGDATPIGVYKAVINHDEMPTETKILAVKALGRRRSEETNQETNDLIHSILDDEDHNVLIKTEAVRAQIEREKEIQDGASILEFAKHLDNPDTHDHVVDAIYDYYLEEGTDPHQLLKDIKFAKKYGYDINSVLEVRTLDRCNRGPFAGLFSGACRIIQNVVYPKIVEFAEIVIDGIVSVATKIGKAIVEIAKKAYEETIGKIVNGATDLFENIKNEFQKYEFDEKQRKCIPADKKADFDTKANCLCLFDNSMFSFVKAIDSIYRLNNFDNSNYFVDERVWGARAVHYYSGVVGYFGINIDLDKCGQPDDFKMVLFGKTKQALTFFGEQFEIVGLEGLIGAEIGQPLRNNFVLTLLGIDIFNYNLLPNAVLKDCQKFNIILLDTTEQTLYRFTRTFFAGFIPFTIEIDVGGGLRFDANIVLCPQQSQYTLELYPRISFYVKVAGSIGIPLLNAGISGRFQLGVGVSITMGRATCRNCLRITLIIDPITLTIALHVQLIVTKFEINLVTIEFMSEQRIPLLFKCQAPRGTIPNSIRDKLREEDQNNDLWGQIDADETSIGPLFAREARDPKSIIPNLPNKRFASRKLSLVAPDTVNFIKQTLMDGPLMLKAPMFTLARKLIESDLRKFLGDRSVDQIKENKNIRNLMAGNMESYQYLNCSLMVEPIDLSTNFHLFPSGAVVSPGRDNSITYLFLFKAEKVPESDEVVIFTRENGLSVSLTKKMKILIKMPFQGSEEITEKAEADTLPKTNKKVEFTNEGEVEYEKINPKTTEFEAEGSLILSKWYSIAVSTHKDKIIVYINEKLNREFKEGVVSHEGTLFIPPKYDHIKELVVGNMCGFKIISSMATPYLIAQELSDYQRELIKQDIKKKEPKEIVTIAEGLLPDYIFNHWGFPDKGNKITEDFSITFMVKPNRKDMDWVLLFKKGHNFSTIFALFFWESIKIIFTSESGTDFQFIWTNKLPTHVYSHITITLMGKIASVFVDGALHESKSLDYVPRKTNDQWILNRVGDFDFFSFKIYNYVLTPKEVLQIAIDPKEQVLFTHPTRMSKMLFYSRENYLNLGLKGAYSITFLASFLNRDDQWSDGLEIVIGATKIQLRGGSRKLGEEDKSDLFWPPKPQMKGPTHIYATIPRVCDNHRNEYLCERKRQCFNTGDYLVNGRWENNCPVYDNPEDDPENDGCKGSSICVTVETNNRPVSVKGSGVIALYPKWTHVSVTFLGQEIQVYYDGILMTSYQVRNNIRWTTVNFVTGLIIQAFNGFMADFKLFNVRLTQMEIENMLPKYSNYFQPLGNPKFEPCAEYQRFIFAWDKETPYKKDIVTVIQPPIDRNDAFKCYGRSISDPLVCSGNGACVNYDQCKCFPGYKGYLCGALDEDAPMCGGFKSYDKRTCTGLGKCVENDKCVCDSGYQNNAGRCVKFINLANIEFDPPCSGIKANDPKACNGRGICENGECACKNGAHGKNCEKVEKAFWHCFGVLNYLPSACSSNGKCEKQDQCKCNSGYTGKNCNVPICNNIPASDSKVCSGNGVCETPNKCRCKQGWYKGQICDQIAYTCSGIQPKKPGVCSNNGDCVGPNECLCKKGFIGSSCQERACFGKSEKDANVCSGNGVCKGIDQCQCNHPWTGDDCSQLIPGYNYLTPIISSNDMIDFSDRHYLNCIKYNNPNTNYPPNQPMPIDVQAKESQAKDFIYNK